MNPVALCKIVRLQFHFMRSTVAADQDREELKKENGFFCLRVLEKNCHFLFPLEKGKTISTIKPDIFS